MTQKVMANLDLAEVRMKRHILMTIEDIKSTELDDR